MKDIDILLVYPKPTKDSPVKLLPLSILFPGAMFEKKGLGVEYFDDRSEYAIFGSVKARQILFKYIKIPGSALFVREPDFST